MKKVSNLVVVLITLFAVGFAPTVVQAQVVEEVGPTVTGSTLPETGASEVKAPDTGIAPSGRVTQNLGVFVGGSAIGAAVGFGIVTLRKKKLQQ